jgi:ring-1,2-phenylacetyl-CoA epoxidase subunit PaaD
VSLEEAVREALAGVVDPEIPTASINDLGMVERVEVTPDGVEIDLLPTFLGCPAKVVIGEQARRAAEAVSGDRRVDVRFVLDPPWTTDRVNEAGRSALREYGISPESDRCPYCGSSDTELSSDFGPTPCRSTHFCRGCRNVFEGFKLKVRAQGEGR